MERWPVSARISLVFQLLFSCLHSLPLAPIDMSLIYDCLFVGPAPDLHQLLDQLIDEYLDEVPEDIAGDNVFCFFENNGTFSLYYVDDEDADSKAVLLIYPSGRAETYTLAFGDFEVQSSWHISFNKLNIARANEALARLLRGVLKEYEGDFVSLFNGEQVILYRTGGRVYLNASSDIAQEPLITLLGLEEYQLKTYQIV